MKKFPKFTVIFAAATAMVTLAGCMGAGNCSGCGGSKVTNTALTNSNWYIQTGYKGIQPYFIDGNHETLVYEVKFDGANDGKGNGNYKIEYSDGKYTTDFYAFEYDWN